MLSDEQKQEILNEAFEKVKNDVVENAISHVDWNIKNELSTRTNEVVKNWVNEVLAPELLISLNENKGVLIEAALVSAETIATELAKAMTSAVIENMSSSYSRKKIVEALFN